MTDSYFFETEMFRFTLTELQLLRNRFPYKKIAFGQIRQLQIKKGIPVKRPLLVALFGLAFIGVGLVISYMNTGIAYMLVNGFYYEWELAEALEVFGITSIISGLMLILGIWALILASVPVLIMKVDLMDGKTERLSLKRLRKERKMKGLIEFLRSTFQPNLLQIHVYL